MGKKTGILGGTFNPVHNGHIYLAKKAMEAEQLDEVLFIPSGVSYMKNQWEILPPAMRKDMVSLAIQDMPFFSLSDMEIIRPGYSYSCDTISQLKKENPETQFYFITGADTVYSMETWKSPEYIFKSVIVLAACRGSVEQGALKQYIKKLVEKYQADVRLIHMESVEISSTEIREYCKQGRSIKNLVPKAVEQYINKNNLYR